MAATANGDGLDRKGTENQVPTIPDHELLRRIGEGAYGEIWLAKSTLGALRAVKVIHRNHFADHRPYEREYSGIQRYEPVSREHEALVDILQVGRNDEAGLFYYVMELADDAQERSGILESCIDGHAAGPHHSATPLPQHSVSYTPRTLAGEIARRKRLPVKEVVALGIQLAQGLQYLHDRRLIHRDVKPSNIIFLGGQAKLADVGMVAAIDATRTQVGTFGYMPIEGPGTVQADIYSLGKVLYEAATGKDRQEFPSLPTFPGADQEEPQLFELNEVFTKACAAQPKDRYQSAAEVAADLRALQAGSSLRQARARTRWFRRAAVAAPVLAGVLGASLLAWFINRPTILLSDSFDSTQIDTNRWSVNWTNFDPRGPPGHQGTFANSAPQTNGALLLQAAAQHHDGNTVVAMTWLDSKEDLRLQGDCQVEIRLSGSSWNAHCLISMGDGTAPDDSDSRSVRLLTVPGDEALDPNVAIPLGPRTVRIRLLTGFQAAIVYPNTRVPRQYTIVDLSELTQWRLRVCAWAHSSTGADVSSTIIRIDKLVVTQAEPGTVVGFVSQAPAGTPLGNASVIDEKGRELARTLKNGAFKFEASLPTRLWVQHAEFLPSAERPIPRDPRQQKPVMVALRKTNVCFGDPVEVIKLPPQRGSCIAFLETNLWALCWQKDGTKGQALLHPLAPEGDKFFPALVTFPTGNHGFSAFTACGRRLVATFVGRPGGLYELDPGKGTASLLVSTSACDGHLIDYPYACAFDGEYLWVLESDGYTRTWGLHALDPVTLEPKRWMPLNDPWIVGLTWDSEKQQFWISSMANDGTVFALDREEALLQRPVEPAARRSFSGTYTSLAYGGSYLWAFDHKRKHICKIKIRD